MQVQNIFSTFSKGIFAWLTSIILLSACGGDGKSGEQASTGMIDTTQIDAPPMTLKLDFEHFGTYDLSTWNARPPKTEAGGDVEMEVMVWEKDGMTIEVEETNKGEYGLDIWCRLTGADGKVQKTRSLVFSNDPFAITETVNDYTVKPAKKYTRTQVVDRHYSQMNPLPTAATGVWKEGAADEL